MVIFNRFDNLLTLLLVGKHIFNIKNRLTHLPMETFIRTNVKKVLLTKVVIFMKQISFKNTAAGKYRRAKANQINSTEEDTIQPKGKPMTGPILSKMNNNNQGKPLDNLFEQIRIEWQNKDINSDFSDKIQSIINLINSEKGKEFTKKVLHSTRNLLKKISIKGVLNAMKNGNLNDLFKNLGENGDVNDLFKKMMNNPEMKQTAMEMMQEVMSDEKKLAEMTEIMSKLMKDNK